MKRRLPRYMPAVIALGLRERLAPGVHHVEVLHDDDCPLLIDGGECACEPEVRMRREPPKSGGHS